MQLQFEKTLLPCLRTLLRSQESQEQTQEVRISDGMPDIGSILGAWGQVILRGKEWQSDTLTVSGGTMVWVQYLPEEGGAPQTMEAWIPFQMRWNIPATDHDGVMLTQCILKSVDARSTSARKMMLRTNITCLLQAFERTQKELYSPVDVPQDLQLHTTSYPILLPSEAGEKAFSLEESVPLIGMNVVRVVGSFFQPQINESRIMADKLIFRGNGQLHILYETEEGTLAAADFDLPFSQYSELDQTYDEDAQVSLWPAVTTLETEIGDSQLHVRAGLAVQFTIRHRPMIRVVDDAYAPNRSVDLQKDILELPGILESKSQLIRAHTNDPADALRAVTTQMLPQPVAVSSDGVQLKVNFHTLTSDIDGNYRCYTEKWEEMLSIPAAENVRLEAVLWPLSCPQSTMISGNLQTQAELELHTDAVMDTGIPMVTGILLGEVQPPDPARPSLILRRAGEQNLWELAKVTGSTVEDIKRINKLEAEPEAEQMLLIPVR